MNTVIIPCNGRWLVLPEEQFREALARGQTVFGHVLAHADPETPPERVLDAKGMEAATKIPASWFLEQARQGKIPHVRGGKYVRFKIGEVLEALSVHPRHADRLSVVNGKRLVEQDVTRGCYHVATKKPARP